MRRILYPILALALATLACSIPTPVTPTQPPVVTEPPLVTEPPSTTNVTCNELSLYLDPALASNVICETIPESTDTMEVYPQHTKLSLQGYLLSDKFFEPHIAVYPVQRYAELLPDFIPGRVADLQALTLGALPDDSALPFLPIFNAGQVFHAQYLVQPFAGGSGIRYLTLFAQYFAPINNHDLFYTYQGLTTDGYYWVMAILPINHPLLPANADNPPEDMSWEDFSNNYEPYLADMITKLNSQAPDSFTPTLTMLDSLVSSITIQP